MGEPMEEKSLKEFVEVLCSAAPVPGGGGASALVGAVGCALGGMVGSLTVGKKKYAGVQEEILALKARSDALQRELLAMMERDAEAFEPLSRAYGLPKETPEQRAEKQRVMEAALTGATEAPLEIMRLCAQAVELIEGFANKGSAIAVSDAGVGAAFCRAALEGALRSTSLSIPERWPTGNAPDAMTGKPTPCSGNSCRGPNAFLPRCGQS